MLLTFLKGKQHLLIALFLLLLGACKQSEFYEKAALLDSEKMPTATESGSGEIPDPGTPPIADEPLVVSPPASEGPVVVPPPIVVVPPVILEPPVVVDPPLVLEPPVVVINPPIILDPPVVVNPPIILDPPVVVNPPVVTEPPVVVNPPVVTEPPVVVNPPVVTEPPVVINPPVILDPPVVVNPPIILDPPVVVNPPIILDPPVVVNPPIILDPPVVVNPPIILDPPVVVNPPVVTEPPVVVNPPVVTEPPVVVNPPVVTEPPVVVNPPVITNPPVVVNPPVVTEPPSPAIRLEDRSEIFTQDTSRDGDVDILWVIDNSGSMADNQAALADNFNNFLNLFLERDVDFKMAITTTDATTLKNGKMVGESSRLTSASANGNRTAFINNFAKWVKVGTTGSGIEQGLKTAGSFLDRYSSSFLRKDAFLAIVFVSDEEDQSGKAVSEYINQYQSTKTNKGLVKAYSIVTQTIQPSARWETIGNRYNDVAMATGGKIGDINDDFATTLKDLGGSIVNLIDRFALAQAPYDNNIQVYVNSAKVTTGWSFDSSTHSLKFNADAIPAEGAKIEVRYKVQAAVLGAI